MREACFTVLDWYILENRIRTPALTAKGNYSSTLCNPHTPNIASLMTNFFDQGNCLTFQSLLRFHQWLLFLFETFFSVQHASLFPPTLPMPLSLPPSSFCPFVGNASYFLGMWPDLSLLCLDGFTFPATLAAATLWMND